MALIETEALRHSYRVGDALVWAVDGIDLAIERGEFVAVMGPSGSGKSTFLYLMGCLAKPTGGSYELDGIDVSRLERNALAAIRNRKLGFVFQNFNLLPRMSALENVQVPLLYTAHDWARAASACRSIFGRIGAARSWPLARRRSFRAESSSASRSPGLSSTSRWCCWPMSRPVRSTRR